MDLKEKRFSGQSQAPQSKDTKSGHTKSPARVNWGKIKESCSTEIIYENYARSNENMVKQVLSIRDKKGTGSGLLFGSSGPFSKYLK